MIGYPSGQDGAVLAAWDYALCPTRKIFPKPKQKPYNKFFIDQAGRILASSFVCMFMDLDTFSVHKHAE